MLVLYEFILAKTSSNTKIWHINYLSNKLKFTRIISNYMYIYVEIKII